MRRPILERGLLVMVAGLFGLSGLSGAAEPPVSDATQDCIACHQTVTPAIVDDWQRSRHARITPQDALKGPEARRRVSASAVPPELAGVVVGCAECHMLRPKEHKDTFSHSDRDVHVVVSPRDCAVCHTTEASQYEQNLMSWARSNLAKNKLYGTLVKSVNGMQSFKDMKTILAEPDEQTLADSCYHCHGTAVEVKGKQTRQTDQGDMEFPILTGWPNQGVGRFNPDGSMGSCSPCHSRHQFAIEVARKPYTCSQCHTGPDVPVYKAYSVSKHGNLFFAQQGGWNFKEVPWTLGKDFTAPTCAVCHVSELAVSDGTVIAKRTHQMSDRLPWRILGLIYAHSHPSSPDTSIIRNGNGQPLPTTFDGEPASSFLIDAAQQRTRRETLQAVCRACHSQDWVAGHWERFENSIRTTNEMTRTATQIMQQAWEQKVADDSNLFDEAIEKQWARQWLFYGNSTRFASAMMGADYGVFEHGRWNLGQNVQEMVDHLKTLLSIKERERHGKKTPSAPERK